MGFSNNVFSHCAAAPFDLSVSAVPDLITVERYDNIVPCRKMAGILCVVVRRMRK